MQKFRRTNENCLYCGGQIPVGVTEVSDGPYKEFRCGECGRTLVRAIIQHDGEIEPANGVSVPRAVFEVTLDRSVNFTTWEAWWTSIEWVMLLNGRPIEGEHKMVEFVEKILDIYDGSS